MVLTSFRAFSKYMENKTGLRLFPCSDPMLSNSFFSFVAPFIHVFMMMSLRRKRIILSSSSSIISFSMSSKVWVSIVSKADDMSIPVILISTSSVFCLGCQPLMCPRDVGCAPVWSKSTLAMRQIGPILLCMVLFCGE